MRKRAATRKTPVGVLILAAIVFVGAAVAWLGLRRPAGSLVNPNPSASTPARPNVNVFIFLIDALRADRLGAYGYKAHLTSPAADGLAQRGVVFENACAPAPWTIPSVASMFTSTFPCEHDMLSMYDRLPDSADTLAERLKRAGYSTYSRIGNEFLGPKYGLHQGFDTLFGGGRNGGKKVSAALGPAPPLPFFFYVHNMEPHNPYHFAPPHTAGFRDVSPDVREQMKLHFKGYKAAAEYDYRRRLPLGTNDMTETQDQHLAALRALKDDWNELYDVCVRLADWRVATTIEMLQKRGFWEKTLFIYVADHGEELGDHGAWLHDQSVYEELMRVPLIIRFPRNEFAGTRVKKVVSLVDVLPTIFDYLQRPELASGTRGRSLMPLVRGAEPVPRQPFTVPGMRHNTTRYYRPWVPTRGDINIVVRRGQWKGIWNVEVDTLELYDLITDPLEQENVQAEHPELVQAMRAYAADWYKHCQDRTTPAEDIGELDEETLRRLRSLGYVD